MMSSEWALNLTAAPSIAPLVLMHPPCVFDSKLQTITAFFPRRPKINLIYGNLW
jgi:hypothetical protein